MIVDGYDDNPVLIGIIGRTIPLWGILEKGPHPKKAHLRAVSLLIVVCDTTH